MRGQLCFPALISGFPGSDFGLKNGGNGCNRDNKSIKRLFSCINHAFLIP
jgi:hypothetical protein